jgi:hypothetical protein
MASHSRDLASEFPALRLGDSFLFAGYEFRAADMLLSCLCTN